MRKLRVREGRKNHEVGLIMRIDGDVRSVERMKGDKLMKWSTHLLKWD